jgi:hypothetical protein
MGVRYQLRKDRTNPDLDDPYVPLNRPMRKPNAFCQDQIALVLNKLKLTVGSKLLDNMFTGCEIQPSIRLPNY